MVVQWEDRFYKGNRGHLPRRPGQHQGHLPRLPRHVRRLWREMRAGDVQNSLPPCARGQGTVRAGSHHPYTEHVLPFIPAGHTVADMIY